MPIYDQDKEPLTPEEERVLPTVLLAVSPIEGQLIVRSLRQSSMAAARELGEVIAEQLRSRV